jgi:acetylornithine/N-succinyldiaminopimelate aminotransferase
MTTNLYYQQEEKKYLFHTYDRYPITLVKGEGQFVWDIEGKKYLDFMSGIACTSLGHKHPEVIKSIKEQVDCILHTSNLFYSPPNIELAKCLVEKGGLDKVFFCNSGTEANECAIKLARKYHWNLGLKNKNVILSVTNSFHGRTLGSLTATAKPKLHEGFAPLPYGFKYESWNDTEKFCDEIHDDVAAVIVEPIQGEGGVFKAPDGFLESVKKTCDQKGALLIFDEVQCGMGRIGELFAYQYFKVKPDIITLAKGIASGLPLGAVCAIQKVAEAFSPGNHGTTFGGNPISCAAALANINTILNHKYLHHVKQMEKYLFEQLNSLKNKFPDKITEIRGAGLMVGIEFNFNCSLILKFCQESGLLLNICGENTIRLLPPFIINESDVDFTVQTISNFFHN